MIEQDILRIINKSWYMSIWSNNIDMIKYLEYLIINKSWYMSIWSNNIDMIKYLEYLIINKSWYMSINNCIISQDNILRIASRGITLDTLVIKENKFRQIIKKIFKMKWGLISRNNGMYTFNRDIDKCDNLYQNTLMKKLRIG